MPQIHRLDIDAQHLRAAGRQSRLRYPRLAFDLVRSATRRKRMFQSITLPARQVASCVPADLPLDARERMREESWPKMAFIEHSIAGDSTNWWAPDPACVEALLRSAGFHIRARREHEVYLCETAERPRWPDLDSVRRAAAAKDEFDS